ncbi:AAA family ATPase [Corynebacterium sp. 335C]
MKLHSIELRNVRGIRHAVIDDIPDTGALVIEAPNESGKSSVAEAVAVCLTEKHSAKKAAIRDMVTYGTSEPVGIRLEMTLDGRRFIVDKTFISKADATVEILEPAAERRTLKKGAADDWLHERCEAAGLGDLWNAFTAGQRGDLNTLKLNEVEAMTGALAAAGARDDGTRAAAASGAGGDAGAAGETLAGPAEAGVASAAARAVMDGVEEGFRRYYTDSGRVTRARQEAADALASAREELAGVERRRRELDHAIGEHERLTAALAAHAEKLPAEKAAAEEAAERLARVEEVQARLTAAAERLEARRGAVTAAVAARDARRAAAAAAVARATAATEAEAALARAEEEAQEADAALAEAEENLGAARTALAAADARLELARRDAAWLTQVDGALAARGRLAELDRLTGVRDEALRARDAETVTAELAERVRAAETDLRIAADRLEAAAASMTLTAESARVVGVDGEDVEIGADAVERTVDGETTLTIDDVTVVVRSGHDVGRVAADRDAAAAALAGLLERAGCADAGEVREAAARRAAADDALRGAEADLAAARRAADPEADRELVARVLGEGAVSGAGADSPDADDAGAGAGADADDVDDADAVPAVPADPGRAAAWSGEGEPPEPPADSAAAAEAVARAEADAADARTGLRKWEGLAEERRATGALENRTRAQANLDNACQEAGRAAGELAAAREAVADADLEAAAETASAALREAAADCDAARAAVDEASPDMARVAADATAAAVANRLSRMKDDEMTRARMEERISGAVGLDDRIADLDARITAGEAAAEEEAADAESWRLLRETLRRAETAAMREYQGPLLRRLRELAAPVFGPGVDFTLDESTLAIVDRTLPGEQPVPFASLSGGAQEQCDILMRLAAASVIDVGESAPVILDDSLTYSDQERLMGMGAAIGRTAADAQVIILTCDPDRFRYVGAERRRLAAPGEGA